MKTRGQVTIADVASAARVDSSVVSRVINKDSRLSIREETRQRVLKAIQDLEYRPNALARGLRTNVARAIELVVPDFENPIYAQMIEGASREAALLGWALVVGPSVPDDTASSSFLNLLEERRVDGLLLASGVSSQDIEHLQESGHPWLLLNRRMPGVNRHIIMDDVAASYSAVQHLVALGHTQIGHIAGPEDSDTAQRRIEGFEFAMAKFGLEIHHGTVTRKPYTSDGGMDGIIEILNLDSPPTAVFVANGNAALGVLAGAWSKGLRVPTDLSVIALHDLALARHAIPPLTTVRMPLARLGELGVKIITSKEARDDVDIVVGGRFQVVARRSTAPPQFADRQSC